MIFVDTSALYALTDSRDANHAVAKARFAAILDSGRSLLTHNYVLLESVTLVQNRVGLDAAVRIAEAAEAFEVEWVEGTTHDEAVRRLKTARRRHVSLVDQVSFLVMRARRVAAAFAFDRHFEDEGFELFGG